MLAKKHNILEGNYTAVLLFVSIFHTIFILFFIIIFPFLNIFGTQVLLHFWNLLKPLIYHNVQLFNDLTTMYFDIVPYKVFKMSSFFTHMSLSYILLFSTVTFKNFTLCNIKVIKNIISPSLYELVLSLLLSLYLLFVALMCLHHFQFSTNYFELSFLTVLKFIFLNNGFHVLAP